MQLMHSENKWEKETIWLFSKTMHVASNRLWHKSQRKQTFRNHNYSLCLWRMPLVSEAAVIPHFSNPVCSLSWSISWSVSRRCCALLQCYSIDWYSSFLTSSPPLTSRFADSIRGMLKLILVLMLAGASLSSTWFTLTCLSRYTHLPATAGGSTAASPSRWHCRHAVQLVDSDTAQSQNELSVCFSSSICRGQ